jgi:pyrimidine-specific ribonucleoside hydrolase
MCGLNLTRQANAAAAEIKRMRDLGNRTGQIVAALLEFYGGALKRTFGISGGSLHDPCAVAALIEPDLIQFQPMHVAVELKGERTYGMTVCDYRHLQGTGQDIVAGSGIHRGEPPNAEVGLKIDKERFFDLLIDTLAQYP